MKLGQHAQISTTVLLAILKIYLLSTIFLILSSYFIFVVVTVVELHAPALGGGEQAVAGLARIPGGVVYCLRGHGAQ